MLLFLTGLAIWGIAIHDYYFTEDATYSFNETTYAVYLTITMFIIPLALTSNLISFIFTLIRFTILFSNKTIEQVAKILVIFFFVANVLYGLIFFSPLFFINGEIKVLLTLLFLSTGVGIPLSVLISSTKIMMIDLTKSKTHNYEGLSFRIISLMLLVITVCFLTTYFFNDVVIFIGVFGVLILPYWIKAITYRFLQIEKKFQL